MPSLHLSASTTPPAKADGTFFRVATYNVLSNHLADTIRFPSCDPAHLDGPTRLRRVKDKLESEVGVSRYRWAQDPLARMKPT